MDFQIGKEGKRDAIFCISWFLPQSIRFTLPNQLKLEGKPVQKAGVRCHGATLEKNFLYKIDEKGRVSQISYSQLQ